MAEIRHWGVHFLRVWFKAANEYCDRQNYAFTMPFVVTGSIDLSLGFRAIAEENGGNVPFVDSRIRHVFPPPLGTSFSFFDWRLNRMSFSVAENDQSNFIARRYFVYFFRIRLRKNMRSKQHPSS
jgi:hypothetical protein